MQKAQTNAAVFVTILMILIVLYILFLPPDVRDKLLDEDNNGDGDDDEDDSDLNKTLIREQPGTVDYFTDNYRDHSLPAFRLFSTESGEVLKEVPSIFVKNSAFEKSFSTTTFKTTDQHSDFLLAFNVVQGSGRLIVLLNGEEVFNGELAPGSPPPIHLPDDKIQSSNTLEIRTSDVGWAIWNAHSYTLSNVVLTANYLDTSRSDSYQTFYMSKEEKNNLERSTLFFYPRCDTNEVGQLFIDVNGIRVYANVADCGVSNNKPLNPSHLFEGENSIRFSTDRGSYLIDNLKIRSYIAKPIFPIYYFNVNDGFFQKIDEDDPNKDEFKSKYDVVLTIKFAGDERKRGVLRFNGQQHVDNFDTYKDKYEIKVDNWLHSGPNAIEIEPQGTLNIIEFTIKVVDI